MGDTLVLRRTKLLEQFTFGELYMPDGSFQCRTLEDVTRREKVQNMTAIPAGIYDVVIAWSNRFERLMPRLLGVPFFSGILIHPGNTAADTDGCILVGRKEVPDAPIPLQESRLAFDDLFPKIRKLCEHGKLRMQIEGGFTADQWTTG